MARVNLQCALACAWKYRPGNNHSCVVKVDDGYQSILLTGDIESPAEQKC